MNKSGWCVVLQYYSMFCSVTKPVSINFTGEIGLFYLYKHVYLWSYGQVRVKLRCGKRLHLQKKKKKLNFNLSTLKHS